MPVPPRRIRVVGTSGSGKTTVAGRLADRLGLPLLEIDAVVHQAGWRTASPQEYAAGLAAFREGAPDGWVVDGPYPSVEDALGDPADTVVWLDLPRAVVIARLVRRTAVRLALRRRLPNGNRERWSRLLSRDPMVNVLLWAWTQHGTERARYAAALAADPRDRWVRLASPGAVRSWLDAVPAAPAVRRIRVVGNSGSGKTTLARRAAHRLGVPHLELDAVFWGPDWTSVDTADAQDEIRRFLVGAPGGWVVDGNWRSRAGSTLDGADLVVWLDYPRRVVMPRVVRRTLGRLLLRRKTWHGNRERWSNVLSRDRERNIIRWAWTEHEGYRRRYEELSAQGSVPVLRLRHPREAERWWRSLT